MPQLTTDRLGGVDIPSPEELLAMREGDYILRARGGRLSRVPVQKSLLPPDPRVSPQGVQCGVRRAPDRAVYVMLQSLVCRSQDGGRTWAHLRPLCTVYGQTYGAPAALRDGTVVVVHDTRYGPGHPGSRAMVSHDEGQTWEDEVYNLDRTTFTGSYSQSVTVDDDTVLTVSAYSDAGNDWDVVLGATHLVAIRWQPVRD